MPSRPMLKVDAQAVPSSTASIASERRFAGPVLDSSATAWAGLPFAVHPIADTEHTDRTELIRQATPEVEGECGLFVMIEGQAEFVIRSGASEHRFEVGPGAVDLTASSEPRKIVRTRGAGSALTLRITPAWLRRLAFEDALFALGAEPTFTRDETVHRLVQTMCSEVARNASTGPLFAESLSLALLSYLARQMAVSSAIARGQLTQAQCQHLRGFVAEHLSGELSLSELSSLVGLGSRHFSTLFRRAFGTTPHKYVMQQRLSEGARLLTRGVDIGDISGRVGFCSQSHFTAAFRQAYGVTPRRYLLDGPAQERGALLS
jgi:AraC-like DNA-binding protein